MVSTPIYNIAKQSINSQIFYRAFLTSKLASSEGIQFLRQGWRGGMRTIDLIDYKSEIKIWFVFAIVNNLKQIYHLYNVTLSALGYENKQIYLSETENHKKLIKNLTVIRD